MNTKIIVRYDDNGEQIKLIGENREACIAELKSRKRWGFLVLEELKTFEEKNF